MSKSPNDTFGPLLANLLQKMGERVRSESGARGVKIVCEFNLPAGTQQGKLKINSFTTPDAKTERLLDPKVPMARGSKLQHDVINKLKALLKRILGR